MLYQLESFAERKDSTFHFHSLGILDALEFTVRNTEDSVECSHKYENHDKLLSNHQSVLSGLLPHHVQRINPQLHMYHGARCFVTSSPLSSADIDV